MPLVQQLNEKYREKGLVVLTVNLGGSPPAVAKLLKDKNVVVPTLVDVNGGVKKDYGVQYFPTTCFIDKDGFIREKVIGGFESLAQIEQKIAAIMP